MQTSSRRTLTGGAWAASCLILTAVLAQSAPGQDSRSRSTERQDITLTTKDGVQLKVSYYPSKEQGQQVVPVVLLHDHKGTRHELDEYARFLQGTLPGGPTEPSFAVIVPDLRGHGGSTQQQIGGRVAELDANRFRRQEFANMVLDLEAIRKFLLQENNAGKLNLNRLVVVGAGMGATVGLNWTAQDWSMPPLATGKQGQDVKVVALVSPEWSYRGVTVAQAMNHPLVRRDVGMFVAFGQRSASHRRDAERIFRIAEKFHSPYDLSQGKEKQEVALMARETNRQGGELLVNDTAVGDAIREFIINRALKQDFPWIERRIGLP